jgi:hypothetical protein
MCKCKLIKAPHYSFLLVASSVDSTYPGVIRRLSVSSTRQRGNNLRAAATHAKAHKNVVDAVRRLRKFLRKSYNGDHSTIYISTTYYIIEYNFD